MSGEFAHVRERIDFVPDWPRPGVSFCDLSALLADARAFHSAVTAIADHFASGITDAGGRRVVGVVGVEARGFAVAAPVALRLDSGFVPARRAGRLPAAVEATDYVLDFGTGLLEVRRDAVSVGDRVLVVDDVLGTGATAAAVVRMVRSLGGEVAGVACVVELVAQGGRAALGDVPVFSVVQFDDVDVVASSGRGTDGASPPGAG